jgi:hypothetical protein
MLFFASCGDCPGCFNNCTDPPDTSQNATSREIFITNQTGRDNLSVYFVSGDILNSCSELKFVQKLNNKDHFVYHIKAGESHLLYYGAPPDVFCSDYESILVKGIEGQPAEIFLK